MKLTKILCLAAVAVALFVGCNFATDLVEPVAASVVGGGNQTDGGNQSVEIPSGTIANFRLAKSKKADITAIQKGNKANWNPSSFQEGGYFMAAFDFNPQDTIKKVVYREYVDTTKIWEAGYAGDTQFPGWANTGLVSESTWAISAYLDKDYAGKYEGDFIVELEATFSDGRVDIIRSNPISIADQSVKIPSGTIANFRLAKSKKADITAIQEGNKANWNPSSFQEGGYFMAAFDFNPKDTIKKVVYREWVGTTKIWEAGYAGDTQFPGWANTGLVSESTWAISAYMDKDYAGKYEGDFVVELEATFSDGRVDIIRSNPM